MFNNYHEIDATLTTAGQTTNDPISMLAADRYGLAINLAAADSERNSNENFLVTQAGIPYLQIPVVGDSPALADLDLFFAMMDARSGLRTLVHCVANTLRLDVPEAEARADLEAIWTEEAWQKYPQWPAFIQQARTHHGRQGAATSPSFS